MGVKIKELEFSIANIHPGQDNPGPPSLLCVTASRCPASSVSASCRFDGDQREYWVNLPRIDPDNLNEVLALSFASWRHVCKDDSSNLACVSLERQQHKPKRRCASCGHKTSKLE